MVMETLGHSQVSLTLNTYSHVLPALQKDAASMMHAILTGSGPVVCRLAGECNATKRGSEGTTAVEEWRARR